MQWFRPSPGALSRSAAREVVLPSTTRTASRCRHCPGSCLARGHVAPCHGVNVLKSHLQSTVWTLLKSGASQREIERVTANSRHTIRYWRHRFAGDASNCSGVATDSGGQTAPPRPPTVPPEISSKCEPHRKFIQAQLRLGRNATAVYQDLVYLYGFDGAPTRCPALIDAANRACSWSPYATRGAASGA
jgi:hypothetical protein